MTPSIRSAGVRWQRRRVLAGVACLGLFALGAGVNCDSDAAYTFRQTATGPIGSGIKTIMNGILDGAIAAVQGAGDGPGASSGRSTR